MKQLTFNDMPQAVGSFLEEWKEFKSFMMAQREKDLETQLPDIIDVKEAARLLGLTSSGVYAKVHEKTIPFFKMKDSNRVRFSRKQLTAWLTGERQNQAA